MAVVGPCEATAADFEGFKALFAGNEILMELGKPQSTDEQRRLYSIGENYVNSNLAGEFSSWEACSAKYTSPGSRLWVLRDEDRVVGSVGVIRQTDEKMELV